ncbi:MAG: methyltransferase domain-containing protein [Candidatus Portnoybacteria bacterium]|nr:methyltransferase domain-containing protein [Candidatus Portnoybacteria bacterium]
MWQKEYKQKDFYWGLLPNPVLSKFINIIPKGKALDVGAGEGRNSLFLARSGFEVDAIDKLSEGLKKCEKIAKDNNLLINTQKCDIKDFKFAKEKYSIVLGINVLDFLKKSEIEAIIKKMKESLIKEGFILLSVFSIKDPMYKAIKERKLKEVEKNTFFLPKYKIYRHFFTKKEIKEILSDFKTIYLKEKRVKDTGHGEPHFHNIIQLLAKRKRQ